MVRFLDLCADAAEPLAPSKTVDEAWHEFVLFTREYAAFCEERYGRFLHHDPYESVDREAFRRTYSAYEGRYGTPDRRIWSDVFDSAGGGGWGGYGSRSDSGGSDSGGGDGGGGDGGGGCGGGGCGGGG